MGKAERCGIHLLGGCSRLECGEWVRDNRAAGAKVTQYAGRESSVAGSRREIAMLRATEREMLGRRTIAG